MTIYSLDILLSRFGTSCCSMSSSNCCFLTCIQVSQEAGQVVWYSHLLKNFPQFLSSTQSKASPGGSEVKASASNARDLGSIPGSGRSPGEGNGNTLQYSCLENPMDRGAWQATVHGVPKSWTRLTSLHFFTQSKALA